MIVEAQKKYLKNGFKKLTVSITAAMAIMPLQLLAGENFVIEHIVVNGLERIDKGVIFNEMPVKEGDLFDTDEASDVIKELYGSGHFSNVEVSRDGNDLVVTVVERPAIGKISITGNKDLKSEDLEKGLKDQGIAEGLTYEQSTLKRVQNELEQVYFSRGKYGVTVETEVTNLERNRVAIEIKISEGVAAKIRKINIIGNTHFTEKELLKDFHSSTPSMFSWFTESDQYSRDKLNGDLENLRSFYLDRGFINFEISSTQVSITPNKKDIYITINVKEGEQYRVADFSLLGDFVVPEKDLESLVTIEPGEVFSKRKMTNITTEMTDRMGEDGYAFSKVNPTYTENKEDKTISLKFYVDPGNRVYVRRINFLGNDATNAEVLRREMRQMESTWVSSKNVRLSRQKLMLTGFFENVDIDTRPVPGTDDQVDIDVKVKEQHSGQIQGALGFSQVDGVIFNFGLRQSNFMGTGKLVDFAFNHSKSLISYRVGYNNPYYTLDGVSRGFDLYMQKTDLNESNVAGYVRDSVGGTITYGIPISETDRLSASLNADRSELKSSGTPTQVMERFYADNGNEFDTYKLALSWSHVTLDKAIFPTKGLSQSLRVQASVPGSTMKYYKVSSNTSYYYPLYKNQFVLLLRNELNYGDGYAGTKSLPVYENFYAGGIGSLRGFQGNSIGPRDGQETTTPVGGNFSALGTAELIVPTPFIEGNSSRLSLFVDAGNVYNNGAFEDNLVSGSGPVRVSAGTSFQWLSPIGPFVISLAKPLNDRPGDKTEIFQFTIGQVF